VAIERLKFERLKYEHEEARLSRRESRLRDADRLSRAGQADNEALLNMLVSQETDRTRLANCSNIAIPDKSPFA